MGRKEIKRNREQLGSSTDEGDARSISRSRKTLRIPEREKIITEGGNWKSPRPLKCASLPNKVFELSLIFIIFLIGI